METVPTTPAVKSPRPLDQNRRQGNRHRLHIPATLTIEGKAPIVIAVTVTQLSVGGLAFQSPYALSIGTTYIVSSFDTLIPAGMRISIASQRQLQDGQFEVGAKTV